LVGLHLTALSTQMRLYCTLEKSKIYPYLLNYQHLINVTLAEIQREKERDVNGIKTNQNRVFQTTALSKDKQCHVIVELLSTCKYLTMKQKQQCKSHVLDSHFQGSGGKAEHTQLT